MSSHGIGLGASKKGRTADSSMVTRNIKIVAQGQSDATYAGTQKKNGFRLSSAILNGDAYNGEALVRNNMQGSAPRFTITLTRSNVFTIINGDVLLAIFSTAIPGAIYTFINETGPDGVIPGVFGLSVTVEFLDSKNPGQGDTIDPPGLVRVDDGTNGTTNYVVITAPLNAVSFFLVRSDK